MTIDKNSMQAAASRVVDRCDRLADFTDGENGLTRTFCSPAMKKAHAELKSWMEKASLICRVDAVGNLIGRPSFHSEANQEDKPVFMIGSHLDTVVNAGRFDGILGVLLGLGVVEVLTESKVELPFEIHVVAFSEEEGVRYKFPFIGSKGIAGTFDPADFGRLDKDGISIRDALKNFEVAPDQWGAASYAEQEMAGFLEVHIEQAVLLQNDNLPIGVVTAIAGQTRATISMVGMAGHAGTVPHEIRKDALAAAAELVLEIEKIGQKTDGLFATVGNVAATPGLSNVICSRTELWLDLRHEHDDQRAKAFEQIEKVIERIANTRNMVGSVESVQHTPAVRMDAKLTDHLEKSIVGSGLKPKELVSGAGHDAMIMSAIAPICMLFVRCLDGISHHPDEFVSPKDIHVALTVMVSAIVEFGQSFLECRRAV